MADIPSAIVLNRDRDLVGRGYQLWIRRSLLGLVAAVPVLALFNVFGQRPQTTTATAPAASLKLSAPERVRSGLLYQARFRVTARATLRHATLVLDPGWLESMTVNTIEPSPEKETSENGRLSLDLGEIAAGRSFLLFIDFQVNPTNVGHRSQSVELRDGDTRLLSISRTITIFP